jgi:hypothetical protein
MEQKLEPPFTLAYRLVLNPARVFHWKMPSLCHLSLAVWRMNLSVLLASGKLSFEPIKTT